VAEAVRALLADAAYRRAAQRVRAEIAAMPAPAQVASQLGRWGTPSR
jgi:UDP:flavonoid glycosyltransferase YjiC (YdhE family)